MGWNHALMIPTSGSGSALAPSHVVNGSALGKVYPHASIISGTVHAFWRQPALRYLSSGNMVAVASGQLTSQDSVGINVLQRSSDRGLTWGSALQVAFGVLGTDAALAGTDGALSYGGACRLAQLPNGNLRIYYFVQGATPPANKVALHWRYQDSTDEGLNWGTPVDFTPSVKMLGATMAITSITSNAGVPRITLTANSNTNQKDSHDGWQTGYQVVLQGLSGNAWATSVNGNPYFVTRISNTVFDLIAAPTVDTVGLNVASATIQTQAAWVAFCGGNVVVHPDGSHGIPCNYRKDATGSGAFAGYAGYVKVGADGTTITCSTFDENSITPVFGTGSDGIIEPHGCMLSNGTTVALSCNTKDKTGDAGYFQGMAFVNLSTMVISGFFLNDGTAGSTSIQTGSTPCPIVALGGGRYVLIANDENPGALVIRRRMTVFYTTDETFKTFSKKRPLFTGESWYPCAEKMPDGTVVVLHECGQLDTDVNNEGGTAGEAVGAMGLVRFNAAALTAPTSGITEQIVYGFNDDRSGEEARTGCACIVDYGTCGHHAMALGRPQYTTWPGRTATVLKIGVGGTADGVQLGLQHDTAWDLDRLLTDSGSFILDIQLMTEAAGDNGVILSTSDVIGQGKANNTHGYALEIVSNKLKFTMCDSTNTSVVSSPQNVNDASPHAVQLVRDMSQLSASRLAMYNTEVNPSVSVVTGTDSSSAQIADTTYAKKKFLGKFDGVNCPWSAAGHSLQLGLLAFTKGANGVGAPPPTIPQFAFPYEPPAREDFAVAPLDSPDLWILPAGSANAAYGMRKINNNGPITVANGRGAIGVVSNGSKRHYQVAKTTLASTPYIRGSNANGGFWTCNSVLGLLGNGLMDPTTIGRFDRIARMNAAWTIIMKINVPTALIADSEWVLHNSDAAISQGFVLFKDPATHKLALECVNGGTPFAAYVSAALSGDTDYGFVLRFDGSGGAGSGGTQGLSRTRLTYAGSPFDGPAVAAATVTDMTADAIQGSTASGGSAGTLPLCLGLNGGGTSALQYKLSDIQIFPTKLTDALCAAHLNLALLT